MIDLTQTAGVWRRSGGGEITEALKPKQLEEFILETRSTGKSSQVHKYGSGVKKEVIL